ncbi:MAG TPA: hypothetical protein VF729_06115 [Solirubrobacterales bacterium]
MSGDKGELREQYHLAVEEYRFQVDLNWRRSEYFFVLNIGVLVAASTLLTSEDLPKALVALVFGLGALLAVLSLLANNSQHGYYQAARQLKEDLESELELGEHALRTTPGMGSKVQRLGRVRTFLGTMLVAIAFVDLTGAGLAVFRAIDTDDVNDPSSMVVIRATGPGFQHEPGLTLVVSRDGEVIATRAANTGRGIGPFELDPGRYRVSALGRAVCTEGIEVSEAPLQLATVRCERG